MNGWAIENSCITKYIYRVLNKSFSQSINQLRGRVGITFIMIHLFIDCENFKQFWTSFYKWWNNISELNIGTNNVFEECTLVGLSR